MSFHRLIFYSAVIGGWAAFVSWAAAEVAFMHRKEQVSFLTVMLAAGLVGAAIAGGLNLLAAVATRSWQAQLPRVLVGLLGGFIGGLVGSALGNLLPRVLGWMLMGLVIGSVDGIYDRSPKKIRNGLIGGGLGGLLGGLLFDPIVALIGGAMSSRATAFVILGLFIGLFIGLAQVILKEAWLTVVAGFRPGRQLILNRPETVLGTSEKAQLPFIAYGAKGVEPVHLRIVQLPDGTFAVEDNNSRTGTQVNGERIHEPVLLSNGDVIQLGPNAVRYSETFRHAEKAASAAATVAGAARPSPGGAQREAIAVAPPPLPPRPAPAPRRPTGDIQVGIPVAPPPRPAPPGAVTPARQRPAPPPMPPAPPPAAPVASDACPICLRPAKGSVGKRICENCGIKF